MRPLAGTPESPASSPSALQSVEQGRKFYKNMLHKETSRRQFKLYIGFGQKYLNEGNWRPEKSRHLDWARHALLNGEQWSFSIKNK